MKSLYFFTFFVLINLSALATYKDDAFFQKILTQANENAFSATKTRNEPVLVMIYIASDNDLYPFAGRNIKQMQMVGTNENVTILIDFHMHRPGQPKVSKRFIIEKNKLTQIGSDSCLDSGDVNTLVAFWKWGIENWPKIKRRVAFIWNHATGELEPYVKQAFKPSELFKYNPNTRLVELKREVGFMDFINKAHTKFDYRGICFDDTTGNYITTQNLEKACLEIKNFLNEKPFELIIFDACLMAMVGIAYILQDYCDFMLASQEVVLGTGLDYHLTLSPFINSQPDNLTFAKHVVSAYHKTYNKITNDFTYSAINLKHINLLADNIARISSILIEALKNQKNKSVKEAIRLSRHKNFCTHFDEPTYIDLAHFYKNLISNLPKFELRTADETASCRERLTDALNQGLEIFGQLVVSNTVGKNLQNAHGLSLYFPDYRLHSSYSNSKFAINTGWLNFLNQYLAA